MKKYGLCLLVVLLCAFLMDPGFARGEEKKLEKVTVGSAPALTAAGMFIAKEKGFFEEEGLDVDLSVFKQSTVEILPLLATNKLDVGACGYSAGILNAFIQDTGVRMVGCFGRHLGGQSHLIVVINKKQCPAELTAADIKGKTFAVPTRGVIQEIITERFLERYGLTLKDVELVNLSYPNTKTAIMNGSVFGSVLIEPYASSLVYDGYAVEIMKASDLRPVFQGGVILYSGDFAENKKDLARKWMVAYLRGVRYFNDFLAGKVDRKEIYDIMDKYGSSVGDFEAFKRVSFGGINPDGFLDKKSIAEDIDWYFDRGYITTKPSVDKMVDDEFAEYAVKELGPYRSDK